MNGRTNSITPVVVLMVCACSLFNAFAQSTLVLSTLDKPSEASEHIASDAMVSATFWTGDHLEGYRLDSITLWMGDAVGDPAGLIVSLYQGFSTTSDDPLMKIADLRGEDPHTAGFYTYQAFDVTLAYDSQYALVLSSDNASGSGTFSWNVARTSSHFKWEGWLMEEAYVDSDDGLNWDLAGRDPMSYAVHATAIPESATLGLICIGGLLVMLRRRG